MTIYIHIYITNTALYNAIVLASFSVSTCMLLDMADNQIRIT